MKVKNKRTNNHKESNKNKKSEINKKLKKNTNKKKNTIKTNNINTNDIYSLLEKNKSKEYKKFRQNRKSKNKFSIIWKKLSSKNINISKISLFFLLFVIIGLFIAVIVTNKKHKSKSESYSSIQANHRKQK